MERIFLKHWIVFYQDGTVRPDAIILTFFCVLCVLALK